MNNDSEDITIYCSRCGAEMKSSSRYCMKCGNLNYDHDANKDMRKFIKNEEKKTYEVGSGTFIANNKSSKNNVTLANKTGGAWLCFIINYGLYIVLLGICFFSLINSNINSLDSFIGSIYPYIILGITMIFLYLYSFYLIFMKMNKKWWYSLIPFYNVYVMSEAVFDNKYIGLLVFVPVINIIYLLFLIYKLGICFNFNGVLSVLLMPIYIPRMAFSGQPFKGIHYVEGNNNMAIERNYKFQQLFLYTVMFFFVCGAGVVAYANAFTINKTQRNIMNYYYVFASRQAAQKIRYAIRNKQESCSNAYNSESGIYYFHIKDLGKRTYLPLYYMREAIEAVVIVDNTSGESKYYVSLTDGTYGFSETLLEDIKGDTVTQYPKITNNGAGYSICKFGFEK